MHLHMHKMYQTTLFQTLFSFALNSNIFLMFFFFFLRKHINIMCYLVKNNVSFIHRPNITINSFVCYTPDLLYNDHLSIMSAETSSPMWSLYTGLTVSLPVYEQF